MKNATQTLDQYFLEMRWRCLSLAADLDRVNRAGGVADLRIAKLRDALKILLSEEGDRAAKVQMIFSDTTPPPPRDLKSQVSNLKSQI